eukprot:3827985-Rhodomonas_salina.1
MIEGTLANQEEPRTVDCWWKVGGFALWVWSAAPGVKMPCRESERGDHLTASATVAPYCQRYCSTLLPALLLPKRAQARKHVHAHALTHALLTSLASHRIPSCHNQMNRKKTRDKKKKCMRSSLDLRIPTLYSSKRLLTPPAFRSDGARHVALHPTSDA